MKQYEDYEAYMTKGGYHVLQVTSSRGLWSLQDETKGPRGAPIETSVPKECFSISPIRIFG
jgi:hypothetical protein